MLEIFAGTLVYHLSEAYVRPLHLSTRHLSGRLDFWYAVVAPVAVDSLPEREAGDFAPILGDLSPNRGIGVCLRRCRGRGFDGLRRTRTLLTGDRLPSRPHDPVLLCSDDADPAH